MPAEIIFPDPTEGKQAIVGLISHGVGLDYLEIADALNYDLGQTIMLTNELLRERKIRARMDEEAMPDADEELFQRFVKGESA